MKSSVFIALLLLICLTSGCSRQSEQRSIVRVAAAANLQFAFSEIETSFEQQNPNVDLVITYGASGQLYAQIVQQAPFDIFFSADESYPQHLRASGIVDDQDLFLYAEGTMACWIREEVELDVESTGLTVLADPVVSKIAIANPKIAPYGTFAEAALAEQGMLEEIRTKIVYGSSVTQTAHLAVSGAADIALLPASITMTDSMSSKGRSVPITTASRAGLPQMGAILDSGSGQKNAELLKQFILSDEGQQLLKAHGYQSVGRTDTVHE